MNRRKSARSPHPSPGQTRARRRPLSARAEEALLHIECAEHSLKTLAAALRVSTATAFRLIGEIRRGGTAVESAKRGRRWFFEVPDGESWENDPFTRSLGFIRNGPVLRPGESVDDVLYGEDHR